MQTLIELLKQVGIILGAGVSIYQAWRAWKDKKDLIKRKLMRKPKKDKT